MPDPAVAASISDLSCSFSAGGAVPPMRISAPVEPVERHGVGEATIDDGTEPGKLDGSMSVDVMCQQSNAPPLPSSRRSFQPLHRHELTRYRLRRAGNALGLLVGVRVRCPRRGAR